MILTIIFVNGARRSGHSPRDASVRARAKQSQHLNSDQSNGIVASPDTVTEPSADIFANEKRQTEANNDGIFEYFTRPFNW